MADITGSITQMATALPEGQLAGIAWLLMPDGPFGLVEPLHRVATWVDIGGAYVANQVSYADLATSGLMAQDAPAAIQAMTGWVPATGSAIQATELVTELAFAFVPFAVQIAPAAEQSATGTTFIAIKPSLMRSAKVGQTRVARLYLGDVLLRNFGTGGSLFDKDGASFGLELADGTPLILTPEP